MPPSGVLAARMSMPALHPASHVTFENTPTSSNDLVNTSQPPADDVGVPTISSFWVARSARRPDGLAAALRVRGLSLSDLEQPQQCHRPRRRAIGRAGLRDSREPCARWRERDLRRLARAVRGGDRHPARPVA